MDDTLTDSLLLEAEAEAEAEAGLFTLHTRHIDAHAPGPSVSRKRAREGPVGLSHLTPQIGPVLTQAPLAEGGGDPDFEDAAEPYEPYIDLSHVPSEWEAV